jgi:hypothetical protein
LTSEFAGVFEVNSAKKIMTARYAFDLKAKASELSPAERRFRVADHPTGTRDLTFIPSG